MWAVKHKSGRVLFVTSGERTANNRRDMGWIVEEVNVSKPKSALIKITWHDDTVSQWHADSFREGEHSIEMNIGGCIVCIPWRLYKDGEVKHLDVES